tara:strand:+ start:271 stop:1680 length:1410 start_codon:yes stop_codon:yes gene_type:complete
MPVGDISPEIAITLTAVLSLVWAITAPQRLQWVCALVALTGIGVAGALVTAQIGTVRLSFAGTFALDEVGAWAQLMILGGTAFCVFLSPGWFRSDPRHGEFYTILLFSALGAMMMVGAADLLQLVMGVLLSSVTGYTLAAYHRDWGLSVEAGMKYFLLGALANALLVTGVVLVFGMLGSSGYDAIADRLAEGNAASPLLYAGFALLAVGVAFKLGAAPAHAWVPDVAEGAPAPAAAFLTVVPKIGAAIALARIVELVPPDTLAIRPLIAVLAVVTMTLGNLAALWQEDVRRLIGWSSVSQAGYILMAVTVLGLSDHALPALLTFVGSYAISNLAAFAVITHLRGRTKLADYVGLATERPVAAAVLTLSFLSLVGIPPLVGFVGKLTLFIATIQGGYAWLAVVAAANTVASLFYYARVIGPVYFGAASKPVAVLDGWSSAALWLGGLAVVIVTLAAGPAFIVFGKATLLP